MFIHDEYISFDIITDIKTDNVTHYHIYFEDIIEIGNYNGIYIKFENTKSYQVYRGQKNIRKITDINDNKYINELHGVYSDHFNYNDIYLELYNKYTCWCKKQSFLNVSYDNKYLNIHLNNKYINNRNIVNYDEKMIYENLYCRYHRQIYLDINIDDFDDLLDIIHYMDNHYFKIIGNFNKEYGLELIDFNYDEETKKINLILNIRKYERECII